MYGLRLKGTSGDAAVLRVSVHKGEPATKHRLNFASGSPPWFVRTTEHANAVRRIPAPTMEQAHFDWPFHEYDPDLLEVVRVRSRYVTATL